MNQDPFIDQLTSGLQKTPERMSPVRSILLMLVMSAGAGLVLTGICGMRADFVQALDRSSYRLEIFLIVAFALIAYSMAERSTIPGMLNQPRRVLVALGVLAAAVLGLLLQHPNFGMSSRFFAGAHCLFLIGISGLLPVFFSLRLLRQGAPTRPRVSMALALFGSFGAAIAVQHIICPNEDPWHLISWHLGILPIAAVAAWGFGRRALGW